MFVKVVQKNGFLIKEEQLGFMKGVGCINEMFGIQEFYEILVKGKHLYDNMDLSNFKTDVSSLWENIY